MEKRHRRGCHVKIYKEEQGKQEGPDVYRYPEKVERREERSAAPPSLPRLSSFNRSGAQLAVFSVLHHLLSPSSLNSSILNPVPRPSKTTLNHPTSSLHPPRLCALSDKSLDYTAACRPFIPLPSIPHSLYSFIGCWLSFCHCQRVVYTAFMSFLLPVSSTSYAPRHVRTNMHL